MIRNVCILGRIKCTSKDKQTKNKVENKKNIKMEWLKRTNKNCHYGITLEAKGKIYLSKRESWSFENCKN